MILTQIIIVIIKNMADLQNQTASLVSFMNHSYGLFKTNPYDKNIHLKCHLWFKLENIVSKCHHKYCGMTKKNL